MSLLTGLLVLLTGCGNFLATKPYNVTTYGKDGNFNVIEMRTTDPESQMFTFRYDTREWILEESEEAPAKVQLVKTGDEKKRCRILPGTIGLGKVEGNNVLEGSLLTQNYVGRTLDVYNPAGIHLMHVVGYEVGGKPYIFEVNLPAKDSKECEIASQAVISTFRVDVPEEAETATPTPTAEASQ